MTISRQPRLATTRAAILAERLPNSEFGATLDGQDLLVGNEASNKTRLLLSNLARYNVLHIRENRRYLVVYKSPVATIRTVTLQMSDAGATARVSFFIDTVAVQGLFGLQVTDSAQTTQATGDNQVPLDGLVELEVSNITAGEILVSVDVNSGVTLVPAF